MKYIEFNIRTIGDFDTKNTYIPFNLNMINNNFSTKDKIFFTPYIQLTDNLLNKSKLDYVEPLKIFTSLSNYDVLIQYVKKHKRFVIKNKDTIDNNIKYIFNLIFKKKSKIIIPSTGRAYNINNATYKEKYNIIKDGSDEIYLIDVTLELIESKKISQDKAKGKIVDKYFHANCQRKRDILNKEFKEIFKYSKDILTNSSYKPPNKMAPVLYTASPIGVANIKRGGYSLKKTIKKYRKNKCRKSKSRKNKCIKYKSRKSKH